MPRPARQDHGSSQGRLPGSGERGFPTDAWAAGTYCPTTSSCNQDVNRTLILYWNGTRWSRVPSPNPGSVSEHFLGSISADSATDAWAAGDYCPHQRLMRYH
jgi:hypothetical protein